MTGWFRTHRPSGRQTLVGVGAAAFAGLVGVFTFRAVRSRRNVEVPEGAEIEVEPAAEAEVAPEKRTDNA